MRVRVSRAGSPPARQDALPGVAGDPGDVIHQLFRLFEDVVVDALEDGRRSLSVRLEAGQVGIVDMARAVGLGVDQRAGESGSAWKLRINQDP